MEFALTA